MIKFGKRYYEKDVGPMYRKGGLCPWGIKPRKRDCERRRGK